MNAFDRRSVSVSFHRDDKSPSPFPPPTRKKDLPRTCSVPLETIKGSLAANRCGPFVVEEIESKRREALNDKLRSMQMPVPNQPKKKFRLPTLVISKGTPMFRALADAQCLIDCQRKSHTLPAKLHPVMESCPEIWEESLTTSSQSSSTFSASEEGTNHRESYESLDDVSCSETTKDSVSEEMLRSVAGFPGGMKTKKFTPKIFQNLPDKPSDKIAEGQTSETVKVTSENSSGCKNYLIIDNSEPQSTTFRSSFNFVPRITDAKGHDPEVSFESQSLSSVLHTNPHKSTGSDHTQNTHAYSYPVAMNNNSLPNRKVVDNCESSEDRRAIDIYNTKSKDNVYNQRVSSSRININPIDEHSRTWANTISVVTNKNVSGQRNSVLPPQNQSVAYEKVMELTVPKSPLSLGFSIEGGKHSPLGDKPITVKRIYKGDNPLTGVLQPDDVIISVNDEPLEGKTHFQAWSLIKVCSEETMNLKIGRRC